MQEQLQSWLHFLFLKFSYLKLQQPLTWVISCSRDNSGDKVFMDLCLYIFVLILVTGNAGKGCYGNLLDILYMHIQLPTSR